MIKIEANPIRAKTGTAPQIVIVEIKGIDTSQPKRPPAAARAITPSVG